MTTTLDPTFATALRVELVALPNAGGTLGRQPGRTPVRRRLVLAGVAGLAASALVVGLPLVGDRAAPTASALSRLAATARLSPGVVIPDGSFLHRVTTETPLAQPAATARGQELQGKGGMSQTWIDARGNEWVMVNTPGSPTEYLKFEAVPAAGVPQTSPADLAAMPTEAAALRTWYGQRLSPLTGAAFEDGVFQNVRDILQSGYAPPALSAAALEVLGDLANTSVVESSRHITVLHASTVAGQIVEGLIFDAQTARLIEVETYAGTSLAQPGPVVWRSAYSAGELVSSVPVEVTQRAVLQGNDG